MQDHVAHACGVERERVSIEFCVLDGGTGDNDKTEAGWVVSIAHQRCEMVGERSKKWTTAKGYSVLISAAADHAINAFMQFRR